MMDVWVNKEVAPEEAWDSHPGTQVIRSKGGKGTFRTDAVARIRGCIDAVLATYERLEGRRILENEGNHLAAFLPIAA